MLSTPKCTMGKCCPVVHPPPHGHSKKERNKNKEKKGIKNVFICVYMYLYNWKFIFSFFADFEIVHPFISDTSGNPVSHDNFHGNRFKRDSSRRNILYLNITGQGHTFEIQLTENDNLLAPGFKVYHRKKSRLSGKVMETEEAASDHLQTASCHYSGNVHSHGGKAALSICDGLVSIKNRSEVFEIRGI